MDALRSIVVATDFSPLSWAALARAITLARLDDATLHLVHASRDPMTAMSPECAISAGLSAVRDARSTRMAETRERVEAENLHVTTSGGSAADPVSAVQRTAEEHLADLIVMGTHGYGGIKHAFLGSVTERTLRSVSCPVMAVKEDEAIASDPIERILLATDFSADADQATELAGILAAKLGARIDLLHALEPSAGSVPYGVPMAADFGLLMQSRAMEHLERVEGKLTARGVRVARHLVHGPASRLIAAQARENRSQLVVVGTRGNTGLAHVFLGSTAERTIRAAPCSVLAVKALEPEERARRAASE